MNKPNDPLLLEARGLMKTFPGTEGAIPVLDGVDFSLVAGESVSISGASGCGKSTLLNVLSGLEMAEAGSLIWQGRAVSGASLSKLAAQRTGYLGFVFQAYYLAPELNAVENVLLGARIAGRLTPEIKARAEDLLNRVGLGHRIKHSSSKLSGGERQRVAVARALINNPPIIMADEPTGNLDESTGLAVMDLLMNLVGEFGKSLVLVTHNPAFAAQTDRRLKLHLGKLEPVEG